MIGRHKMRIAIGADHAGFPMKQPLVNHLESMGHNVMDIGAHELDPKDDYPDFAEAVTNKLLIGDAERGIIVCGSGVGASVAANKVRGIRASVCHDKYSAQQGVEHDDINVLCIGGRVVDEKLAMDLVSAFVDASFTGEARHKRRLLKVLAMEAAMYSESDST